MNDIQKAVRTWLSYEDTDRYNEDKARELIKARIEVREALRNGYKLIDELKVNNIIMDVEYKINQSEIDAANRWLYELCQKANAYEKLVNLIKEVGTND